MQLVPSTKKVRSAAVRHCSMWGSNPRPLAHKTNTLPTELMEHACHSWVPQCPTSIESRVRGLVVMIVACQVMDPGSIPGERIFFSSRLRYRSSDTPSRAAWALPPRTRKPSPHVKQRACNSKPEPACLLFICSHKRVNFLNGFGRWKPSFDSWGLWACMHLGLGFL